MTGIPNLFKIKKLIKIEDTHNTLSISSVDSLKEMINNIT